MRDRNARTLKGCHTGLAVNAIAGREYLRAPRAFVSSRTSREGAKNAKECRDGVMHRRSRHFLTEITGITEEGRGEEGSVKCEG